MEPFIEILKEVNVIQIFVILGGFWMFYNRLDKKINYLDQKLSNKIDDIDRRLCRIEGSLATQGHCLFSQKQPDRKTE